MKTANKCKTKPNETKAWLRSPFTPSGQVTDLAYSTAPGTHMTKTMSNGSYHFLDQSFAETKD